MGKDLKGKEIGKGFHQRKQIHLPIYVATSGNG